MGQVILKYGDQIVNENAKKWVAALRSGEYQQTKSRLQNSKGYCCLGVACDLYEKELGVKVLPRCSGYYDATQEGEELSGNFEPVRVWLGLRDSVGQCAMEDKTISASLAEANDDGLSFSDIADILESEPEGLFV